MGTKYGNSLNGTKNLRAPNIRSEIPNKDEICSHLNLYAHLISNKKQQNLTQNPLKILPLEDSSSGRPIWAYKMPRSVELVELLQQLTVLDQENTKSERSSGGTTPYLDLKIVDRLNSSLSFRSALIRSAPASLWHSATTTTTHEASTACPAPSSHHAIKSRISPLKWQR